MKHQNNQKDKPDQQSTGRHSEQGQRGQGNQQGRNNQGLNNSGRKA